MLITYKLHALQKRRVPVFPPFLIKLVLKVIVRKSRDIVSNAIVHPAVVLIRSIRIPCRAD